jgi:hypothetical protein
MTRRAALWMLAESLYVAYLIASLWRSPSYWRHRREAQRLNRFLAEYVRQGGRAEVRLYPTG